MGDPTRASVIVIGMGPVGMTAALALARRGIPVTVLEAGDDLSAESRASTFHPPSLEILDHLGVYDDLLRAGMKASRFQYRTRSGHVIADLDLTALSEDTRFPYRLQCEQSVLTRIVREHLEALPHVTLRFDAPVARVEVGSDHVHVYLPEAGYTPTYTADWVLAADGSNSTVRRSLGIAFEGMTYPERFLVTSTTHDFSRDLEGLAPVSYIYDPDDWGVLLRTPDHWRVLFPIDPQESNEDAVNPDTIERRLQCVVKSDEPYPVTHSSIYSVHQRVAAKFAEGRVLLMGDAAHINNPLGGLGMNSGIHDAQAAVEALNYALEGGDPARAAEVYARVRRDAATHDVQRSSHQNYKQMRSSDVDRKPDSDLAAIATDPHRARAYLRITSMLCSHETSMRRLRWGLTPLHAPASPTAAQVLSASLRTFPHSSLSADELPVAARPASAVPAGTDELVQLTRASSHPVVAAPPDDISVTEAVTRFERSDIAAIMLTGADDVAEAVAARSDLLVIADLNPGDQQLDAVLNAAAELVRAGADIVAVSGSPALDLIDRVHQAVPSVPLALGIVPDETTDAVRLGLAGVCLLLQRSPETGPSPSLAGAS